MTRSAVRNAADEQQIRRAGKREQTRLDRERAELRRLLSSVDGMRCLWRVYVMAGGKDSTFSTDPIRLAALAGQREIALWLESSINDADPEAMIRMRMDAARVERETALELEQDAEGDYAREQREHAEP